MLVRIILSSYTCVTNISVGICSAWIKIYVPACTYGFLHSFNLSESQTLVCIFEYLFLCLNKFECIES